MLEKLKKLSLRLATSIKYRSRLIAESEANYIYIDKQRVDLESVIVYMKKNNTFYLPKKVKNLFYQ